MVGQRGSNLLDASISTLEKLAAAAPIGPTGHGGPVASSGVPLVLAAQEPRTWKTAGSPGDPRPDHTNVPREPNVGCTENPRLDHVIIFDEGHLKRVLRNYLVYYHRSRAHLGLKKDCPIPRIVEPPGIGRIESEAMVGGLHRRYFRRAA